MSNSTYSPDGRNFQVEYVAKAVENGGTSIGIKCSDGVVFAVEKVIVSQLLAPGKNKLIQTVDKHVGVVYSGLIPDGKRLASRARDEADSFRTNFKDQIPVPGLMSRLGEFVRMHTCANSVRPMGVAAIIGGMDANGPHLYMVEPSGVYWGYRGAATGKGRQSAKSELEKLDLPNITCREATKHAAKIIYTAHEDNKDKEFELEMSWCCDESGKRHTFVPEDVLKEAISFAQAEDEDVGMEE